ncbi:hypothetical protein [Brevundimonas denitrificans]|uniref:hypothetical protein n=1 Tax=Brevundimonas denitrificans TaxID=1443434 RepID=UPI00223B7DC0|nr:hypothetical protein [Brevundimonas denitrificans]
MQHGILGEQLARQFDHIVQIQPVEPARVGRRDRAGRVEVEHHIVQQKEHRTITICVGRIFRPLMVRLTGRAFSPVHERG